jgi:hypothetical protein
MGGNHCLEDTHSSFLHTLPFVSLVQKRLQFHKQSDYLLYFKATDSHLPPPKKCLVTRKKVIFQVFVSRPSTIHLHLPSSPNNPQALCVSTTTRPLPNSQHTPSVWSSRDSISPILTTAGTYSCIYCLLHKGT